MGKKLLLSVLLMVISYGNLTADEITGFWKSINKKTGNIQCVFAIYEYQDRYYGRIISTYNENGVLEDSIYSPKKRAPGVKGNPFYCGMDLLWNLRKQASWYTGKIMDPEKGNVYNAEVFLKDNGLAVRGEFLVFSRTEVWPAAKDTDFPPGFKKPDLAQFVPVIPK